MQALTKNAPRKSTKGKRSSSRSGRSTGAGYGCVTSSVPFFRLVVNELILVLVLVVYPVDCWLPRGYKTIPRPAATPVCITGSSNPCWFEPRIFALYKSAFSSCSSSDAQKYARLKILFVSPNPPPPLELHVLKQPHLVISSVRPDATELLPRPPPPPPPTTREIPRAAAAAVAPTPLGFVHRPLGDTLVCWAGTP